MGYFILYLYLTEWSFHISKSVWLRPYSIGCSAYCLEMFPVNWRVQFLIRTFFMKGKCLVFEIGVREPFPSEDMPQCPIWLGGKNWNWACLIEQTGLAQLRLVN